MGKVVYDGITVEFARAILKEAQSQEILDGDLPEEGPEIIELANYYIDEAQKAYDIGMRSDAVMAIKNMAEGTKTQSESASAEDDRSDKHKKADAEDAETIKHKTGVAETYPRRSSGGLSESDEREVDNAPSPAHPLTESLIRTHNLPIPGDWQEDPTPIPRDLTPLSDIQIRSLHGEYNAYQARARYLLVLEKADLRNASILRDEALRQAMLEVDRIDAETKKAKTISLMEAEAMEDKSYKLYSQQVAKCQTAVEAYQTLVDIYSGNVAVLSREWTMRQDEWNKSR